jgi:hypothetical protein
VQLKSEVRRSTIQADQENNVTILEMRPPVKVVSEVNKSANFASLNVASADHLPNPNRFQTVGHDDNYNIAHPLSGQRSGSVNRQIEYLSNKTNEKNNGGRSIVSLGGNASNSRPNKGKAYLPQGKRSSKRKRVPEKGTAAVNTSNNPIKLHQQLRNSNLRAVYAQS